MTGHFLPVARKTITFNSNEHQLTVNTFLSSHCAALTHKGPREEKGNMKPDLGVCDQTHSYITAHTIVSGIC